MPAAELLTFDPDGDLLLRLSYPADGIEGNGREGGVADTETLTDGASADREGTMTPEEELDETLEEAGNT